MREEGERGTAEEGRPERGRPQGQQGAEVGVRAGHRGNRPERGRRPERDKVRGSGPQEDAAESRPWRVARDVWPDGVEARLTRRPSDEPSQRQSTKKPACGVA